MQKAREQEGQCQDAPSLCKAWRGTWGPLTDGRSRLGRLVKEIEQELVKEHLGSETHDPTTGKRHTDKPRQRRLLRRAAKLEALAEQTADTLGVDPKATKRSLTALERAADNKIAQVRASFNGRREPAFDPVAAFGKKGIDP